MSHVPQGIVPGTLPQPEQQCDYNLGDVILGMPVIVEGCREERVRLEHRLPVIVTHGLCHLLGYRHRSELQWKAVRVLLCGGTIDLEATNHPVLEVHPVHFDQSLAIIAAIL